MKKISKVIKCLMLVGFLLSANCQKAEAFLFPPMPWDPVLDIPNDAGKYIGEGLKVKHTITSGLTMDNALGLSNLKGGLLDDDWKGLLQSISPEMDKKGKLKTPGKGAVSASSTLKIDEGSVDEEQFFNAYHTLFFTHDFNADGIEGASQALLEAAYKNKAEEYQQDMAIDTYLTAKLVEDYLITADKTLDRLEECQKGVKEGKEYCTFFGMQMAKVTDESAAAGGESDPNNKAQLAATRNAYIVTMVYDRILRIIEELTATEAMFQAGRQMGIAKPISVDNKQSNAEEYLNYRFVYTDSQDYAFAKGTPVINFNDRAKECEGSSDPQKCPQVNKDKTEVKSVESMDALKDLQPIEDKISKAVAAHNLKSTLPQLKSQYRQYLLQKEIHEKAKKLVETSEQCVVDFLQRHAETPAQKAAIKSAWYGGAELKGEDRFKFDTRQDNGISGVLIKKYDEKSTDITLGTSEECDGFYEANACPAGYEWNSNKCCYANKNMCACEVELITENNPTEDEITTIEEDYIDGSNVAKIKSQYKDIEDTDGLKNGNNAETIVQDSRKSAELTWYLGRDALLDAMQKYNLKFNPWNDQKMLQAEYLRNKYRNIKLIIKSTDQAVASFKIVEKAVQDYSSEDIAQKYIKAAASCEPMDRAKELARSKYCTAGYVDCSVTDNNGMIKIRRKRYETRYDSDGNPYTVKVSVPDIDENQKVSLSNTCTYKKASSSVNLEEICLTPTCMVKTYFKKAWGDADGFYEAAKTKGRIVAVNKLGAVMTVRGQKESEIKELIDAYQKEIATLEGAVKDAIANLTSTNEAIDQARKNKNIAVEELNKTNQRLKMIDVEIKTLENRKDYGLEEDITARKDKIAALENERSCLKTGNPAKADKENKCDAHLTTFTPSNGMLAENKTDRYITVPEAKATKDKYEKLLDEKMTQLDTLKERVRALQGQLAKKIEEFATEYLKAENEAQGAIEEKNWEYEKFMESEECGRETPCQMRKGGNGKFKSNNLESTFVNIISSGSLLNVMKEELNRVFFPGNDFGKFTAALKSAGVPDSFFVDGTFGMGLSGTITVDALARALKDEVVKIAATELTSQIKKADGNVAEKVQEAVDAVEGFVKARNLNGEGKQAPEQSYLEKPSADHKELLNTLRGISKSIVEGENLFGIPEDSEFAAMLGIVPKNSEIIDIADNAYFVALPARGNNYRGRSGDAYAGRDYIAPKDMLSSIPPLREVFYFSAADYETVPQEKGKPVLTELLNCKYFAADGSCEIEYLPEVWLHILARPNLRADKKYQQTFVERSFSKNKLNELVENRLLNSGIVGAKPEHYRAIIGRAGVYPCKVGGKIVDMGGGDKVTDMKFKTRGSLPGGVPAVNCQEVQFKGAKIYHLLADHGKGRNIKDTESPGSTSEPMYEKYSELGQMLTEKMKYRPLQKNMQEYLNDTKNTDNNITRQKAELASFKRNTMGDFLKAVANEIQARKNVESSEKSIRDSMEKLCKQLKEMEVEPENCTIQKLATSYKDNKYYEKEEGGDYGQINIKSPDGSFYENIFYELNRKKEDMIMNAQNDLNKVKMPSLAGAQDYVNERLEKIKNYIGKDGTLIQDNNEIATIQPDIDPEQMQSVLKTARTNRQVMLDSAEEGLQAMENQSQAVAYCPVY